MVLRRCRGPMEVDGNGPGILNQCIMQGCIIAIHVVVRSFYGDLS